MSRFMKWAAACGLGLSALSFSTGISSSAAKADDVRLMVKPAVVQTTTDQVTVPVQQVGWRRGWGPGYGVSVYRGPGVGVYVGQPRVWGPAYYPRRVYGGYYGAYPYGYGYGYAAPGYVYPNYGYNYAPAYGYYW